MAALLQNRTISMILTVPEVKELIVTPSQSADDLYERSASTPQLHKPPSIPIYTGSIIRVEHHADDQSTADLIVRVPNYRHSPSSSVTISINPPEVARRPASFKRRAPICPLLTGSSTRSLSSEPTRTEQSETNVRLTHAKRLAGRLQNLSQALTSNCKPKRSTSIDQIMIIPVLPDVEIIREHIPLSPTVTKTTRSPNRTANFITPKILSIKQKYLKITRKQPSEPPLVVDSDSTSIHRYSTLDLPATVSERDASDIAPAEPSDDVCYVVHPNGDTYSECYEVTYQFDPDFRPYAAQKQIDGDSTHEHERPASSPTFETDAESNDALSIPTDHPADPAPYLTEDYSVIIELLKNVLQLETTTGATHHDELEAIRETD